MSVAGHAMSYTAGEYSLLDARGLRGGFAVAAAPDEAVDAGDERFDVHREASLAFQKLLLRFEELAVAAPGLALRSVGGRRELAESFDDRMEHLLGFEVLLADTSVELAEPPFVEAVRDVVGISFGHRRLVSFRTVSPGFGHRQRLKGDTCS